MLHSLGLKLAESLRKLSSAPSVDDALVKGVLKDVSSALLEADVSLRAPTSRAADQG
jgi:signal recognition particle GTPase